MIRKSIYQSVWSAGGWWYSIHMKEIEVLFESGRIQSTSLYKEYACFNFSNFPIYPPGFANFCSLFPRAHASLPTCFSLQANVKQGGRVGKGEGLDVPYWSQKGARTIDRDRTLGGLELLTCRLVGWGRWSKFYTLLLLVCFLNRESMLDTPWGTWEIQG